MPPSVANSGDAPRHAFNSQVPGVDGKSGRGAWATVAIDASLWMLIGVFWIGDRLVERRSGSSGSGAAMGIVVGSVVVGVREWIIFGIQICTGIPISARFLAASVGVSGPASRPRWGSACRFWEADRA